MTIASVLLFLAAVASGIYLCITGAPYPTLLITVHKLISLLATAGLAYTLIRIVQKTGVSGFIISMMVVVAVLAIMLFASGALMIIGTPRHAMWRILHIAASTVITIALVLAATLVMRG